LWRNRIVQTATTTSTRLECSGLTVAYGELVAVDHIDLEVEAGEVFGLLGPNGAGKTSVIRALTTILEPVDGTATVAGADLSDRHTIRRLIGVLPESSGYPRAQTGHSYLRFYGELFGLTRSEAGARAEQLLDQLGLGDTSQRISHYSRGMRQRLGLCRAMINRPQVLFLDEPTLGLDPAGKEEVVRHLARIAAEDGTTVVLCTHLLDEVERVCDRVAIMADGHLLTTGTVDDVIASARVPRSTRLRVHPGDLSAAHEVLLALGGIERVSFDNARPGDLDLRLADDGDAPPSSRILTAIIAAGIEVRAYETDRVSLNDAFLSLTSLAGDPSTPIRRGAS
jgi:ABC-2 type transport system ATP-binding protein